MLKYNNDACLMLQYKENIIFRIRKGRFESIQNIILKLNNKTKCMKMNKAGRRHDAFGHFFSHQRYRIISPWCYYKSGWWKKCPIWTSAGGLKVESMALATNDTCKPQHCLTTGANFNNTPGLKRNTTTWAKKNSVTETERNHNLATIHPWKASTSCENKRGKKIYPQKTHLKQTRRRILKKKKPQG